MVSLSLKSSMLCFIMYAHNAPLDVPVALSSSIPTLGPKFLVATVLLEFSVSKEKA